MNDIDSNCITVSSLREEDSLLEKSNYNYNYNYDYNNNIHELISNVNYKLKSTTTGLLSINSTSTVISLNGPTIKDIPSIKLSQLPNNIEIDQFINYIESIDDLFDDFQSSKSLTYSSLNKLNNNNSSGDNLNPLNEEQEAMLDFNNLSNIPDFYFDDDFRLDNPKIFNKVINGTKFSSLIDDDGTNGTNTIVDHDLLQEKLSSNLDIIEIHLINEISKSSDKFFSALDDLKNINNVSNLLSNKLIKFNNNLDTFNENKIENSKNLINLITKYQNIEKFKQLLLQIKTILIQADLAESNYYNGNYEISLQLIDSVFALIRGNVPNHPLIDKIVSNWKYPLKDLNKLPALLPLKRLLSNLISDTGKSYAKLFSNYLIDDLRNVYENLNEDLVLNKLTSNENSSNNNNNTNDDDDKSYLEINDEFKSNLEIYLKGLTRCGELSSAFKLYEERFSNELKSIFKSNLPSENNNNNEENDIGDDTNDNVSEDSKSKSNITNNISNALMLSDLVKNLTPKEFELMIINNYTKFFQSFRRLIIQKNLLLTISIDVLNNFDSQILKIQPDIINDLDLTNSISLTINSIQRRIAKLFKIRELQNCQIPLNYFIRLYKLNVNFLNQCEILSNGMINESILKEINNKQLFNFIQQFHKKSLKKSIQLIELEIWKDEGLPINTQNILDLIINASNGDFDYNEWTKGLSIDFNNINNKEEMEKEEMDKENTTELRKSLTLHSQNYILPSSMGIILITIKAYLLLIHLFKNKINNIISQNYLPELLKAINLKIHQSILGAQASKTAGLKHITTKHLAFACEVCRFWSILVNDISRVCLSEIDNNNNNNNNNSEIIINVRKNIIKEFDEVKELFKDQVVDLYDKLVSIMRDTVGSVLNRINVKEFVNRDEDVEDNEEEVEESKKESVDKSEGIEEVETKEVETKEVESEEGEETKEVSTKEDTEDTKDAIETIKHKELKLKVNSYMDLIVKNTLTIARSVQRYLPREEYDNVMKRIFEQYVIVLIKKYNEILDNEQTNGTKDEIVQQIRRDLNFFNDKIKDIEVSAGTIDKILESVVV